MRLHIWRPLRGGRLRVGMFAVAGGLGAGLLMASPVGAGGEAGFGCAPGFDLGETTLEEGLGLPRIEAALAAGVVTESDLVAQFDAIDHNGDDLVCFKDVGALNGGVSNWQFFYNAVDNNASVPGS